MAANKKDPNIPPGIALVVDAKRTLRGIVTNGDIRRAFAAGLTTEDKVSMAMNADPSVIEHHGRHGDILASVFEKIKHGAWPKDRLEKIIVVDAKRRVVDLVSFYDLVQQSDIRFKHIGIVGLGYVGLTLGLTLADLGFRVKGYEIKKEVADSIRKGKPHFFEHGLDRLLKDHMNKNFRVVPDFNGGNNADVYFIAVGTPLDDQNKPNLSHLASAARTTGRVLKKGDAVILRSTVPIGTTRNIVAPILEQESGLKAGEEFLLAFAPERTIEGKALEELRTLPQVIGGINRSSCDAVASIFNFMSNSTVLADSLESAEMVKLINNTYRDVTFGFANEVALVASQWGIDAAHVIRAANYGYERSNIPMPSPGVGGYCLEKDPYIFMESGIMRGYEPVLAKHARAVNTMMIDHVVNALVSFLKKQKAAVRHPNIFILGFAFKGRPVTSDMRGSTTVALVKKLQALKFTNIHGYDPAVPKVDITGLGIKHIVRAAQGFEGADIVAVMNNHPDFETLDVRALAAKTKKPTLLFDAWALFDPEEMRKVKGVEYRRL